MQYFLGLRTTFNNLVFIGFTLLVLLWLSVFLYGTFYYLYIPAFSHNRPVYLQFKRNSLHSLSSTSCQSTMCSFPSANVTLVKRGYDQLLSRGQLYKIALDMEMPESDVNRRLGMFMVKLSIYSKDGNMLKTSFRSALLHYKSPLLRYLYTFFFSPFLLAGTSSEKQLVTVSLFEHFEEDPLRPAYGALVEIHSRVLEVYSATLRIHAHFTGLRYLMYYWPGLSTTIGVITIFYFLLMIALFSWYRFMKWQGNPDYEDIVVEKSRSMKEKDFKTPIPLKQTALSVSVSPSKAKTKQTFDLISKLTGSPEKKTKESLEMSTKSSVSKPISHSRVFEVDITQGIPTMSTIEEEETDSCDVTPMSDDEKTAFEGKETELRQRK